MVAGNNTAKRNEAKDSLLRLLFGGVAIALAPFFVRFLLFLNNSFIHIVLTASNGGLDDLLGNEMLSNISTGNAITTALVISMFIYLFVKLNIKFIVRQFTIIVLTIFTPIVAGLWIINRNVTAASIWFGQIMINVFMQFIYCFLFLIYMSFLPSTSGWAVSLIWAMMLLPIADVLMNMLQNLTSRIAGLDNNEVTGRALGMGAAFGYTLSAMKQQFSNKAPIDSSGGSNVAGAGTGLITRIKNFVNPGTNLSAEKDYDGNINPIREVVPTSKTANNNVVAPNIIRPTTQNQNVDAGNEVAKSKLGTALGVGVKATKAYLDVGAKMAEGNFEGKPKFNNNFNMKNKINNKQLDNTIIQNQNAQQVSKIMKEDDSS